MNDGFKNYKHVLTGIVSRLPETYGDLFPDTLYEVDEEALCNTCGLDEIEPLIEDEPVIEEVETFVARPEKEK